MSEEVRSQTPEEVQLELFVLEWIKCGFNATKAYLKSHPKVTKQSAAVLGFRMLKKVNIPDVLAAYGLGYDVYLAKLREGLDAHSTTNTYSPRQKKFVEKKVPDYRTRREYHKALGKALKLESDKVEHEVAGELVVRTISYADHHDPASV